MRMDEKTTCVGAETITGFVDYQVSSCVDPKNFSYDIGYELALKKVRTNCLDTSDSSSSGG